MRSRANIKAHPLHPALIPFPFALLSAAVVFDLAARLFDAPGLSVTAAHLTLAGVSTGILAAIPGVIDYLYSVPPESSGKARATRHALGNAAALTLFGLAFVSRADDWTATLVTVALEVTGGLVLAYAAALGGTLVTRNLISVDHRYANKGQWQEASFEGAPGAEIRVAGDAELGDGHMKLLRVNGRRIVLARVGDRYCAADDRCTHRGGSLAGGVLIDSTVQCLWHGSQFDICTGAVRCGPAKAPIKTFDVRRAGGDVLLTVPRA